MQYIFRKFSKLQNQHFFEPVWQKNCYLYASCANARKFWNFELKGRWNSPFGFKLAAAVGTKDVNSFWFYHFLSTLRYFFLKGGGGKQNWHWCRFKQFCNALSFAVYVSALSMFNLCKSRKFDCFSHKGHEIEA